MTKVTVIATWMHCEGKMAKTTGPGRLDVALEVTWLLLIFLLPLYFNPLGYQAFYFAKALLLQLGVCLMLGLYLARWFMAGRHGERFNLLSAVRRSPLQAAVIVFGLVWAVSTALSIMPGASFWGSLASKYGLTSIMAWVAFFLILAQGMRRRPQLQRALIVLIVSAGLVSLFGVLEFADPGLLSWLSVAGRVSATDGNPLSLSGFLSMVLPLNLSLIMITCSGTEAGLKKAVKLVGLLLAFTLQIACLCLAQYSVTILLFVPGLALFFLLLGIYLRKKAAVALSLLALLLLAMMATLILGQLMLTPMAAPTAEKPAQAASLAESVGLDTLERRVDIWRSALSIILDSPKLPLLNDNRHALRRFIGYGPEMLVVASQSRFPASLKSEDTFNSLLLSQPENHYLYLAATIGLLGLAAFLAVIIIFFYLGFMLLGKSRKRDVTYLACAFMAGIAQYCVHILFNPTAILPELVFWLILALMVALVRLEMSGGGVIAAPADDGLEVKAASESAGGGILRKAIAVLMVIVFIVVGFSLIFRPAVADMKLNSALSTWSSDAGQTLSALAEAAKIEPPEAVYYGYIGAYAFKLAIASDNATQRSSLMSLSTTAYSAAGTCEPYLAYWSYNTGDAYSYWAGHTDPAKWKDALRCYERADILLPENAVILNKWALALMLSGDFAQAGQKLSESLDADGAWVQTTYFMGLLDVYAPGYCMAGNCFVYPVEQKAGNVGDYIVFCRQLALYGGLDKVIEGLKVYTAGHPDDWTGQALLGIAEVFDNRLDAAEGSFRKAAANVPAGHALTLKQIVTRMGVETPGFQATAQEIAGSLEAKIPDSIK